MSTDYFPPIQRAVQNLSPNTLDARRALYDKARAALLKQLRGADPALTESQITKERLLLEDAIRRIETDMLRPETAGRVMGEPRPAVPAPQAGRLAREPARVQPVTLAEEEPPYDDGFEDGYDDGPADEPVAATPRRNDRPRPQAPRRREARPSRGRSLIAASLAALVVIGGGIAGWKFWPADMMPMAPLKIGVGVAPAPAPTPDTAAPLPAGKLTDRLGEEPTRPPEPTGQPAAQAPTQGATQAPPAAPGPQAAAPQAAAPDAPRQAALPEPAPDAPAQPASPSAGPTAALTPEAAPAAAPTAAQPLSPAPRAGAVVAQSAILYEEQPDNPQRGQAFQGTVAWRTESVSAGTNAPLETAVKGEIDIPERKIHATLTVRKNADPALPATHTLELQFVVPNDFPNGGIANVPGVLMKQEAQQRGAPLQGLSVKVTNGFFLVGLSDAPTDGGRNAQLLKEREWMDIPVLYDNGRRAILTLEKGVPGNRAFAEAFAAWDASPAAQQ